MDNLFLQADSRIVLYDIMDQITGRLLSVAHSLKHEDDKGEVTIKIKLEKTFSGIKIGKELSMKHAPVSGKNVFAVIDADTGQMQMEQGTMDFLKMREENITLGISLGVYTGERAQTEQEQEEHAPDCEQTEVQETPEQETEQEEQQPLRAVK